MCRRLVPMQRKLRRTHRLHREEDRHARRGRQEQEPAPPAVDLEARKHRPAQVPDREDAGDEQLDLCVRDADRVEDLGEVVRDEAVAGPLGEPGDRDDDAHPLAVAGGRDERFPADVLLGCAWKEMRVSTRDTRKKAGGAPRRTYLRGRGRWRS